MRILPTDSAPSQQGRRVWLLAAVLVLTGACTAPVDLPGVSQQTSADSETSTAPDEATDGEEGEDADEAGTDESDEPQIEVRTLDVRTSRAGQALERNYRGFLDRQPLGFSTRLFDQIGEQTTAALEAASDLPDTLRRATPLQILVFGLPCLVVATFLAGYFVLARQVDQYAHRLQAEFHLDLSTWATRLIRGLVLVTGRAFTLATLVALSYFPVQAVFGTRPWTELLSTTLWYLLGYTVLASLAVTLFSGRVLQLDETPARRLERRTLQGLRLVFGFLILSHGLQHLEVTLELVAFVQFLFRLALVAFPLALYVDKEAVLHLLPDVGDSRLYALFRRAVVRHFRAWMAATALLFAMRAAGYLKASRFILVRGYLLVALVVVLFVVFRAVKRYVSTRVDYGETPDTETGFATTSEDRASLSRRIEQLVGLGLIVIGLAVSLKFLWLLEPTLIVLRAPFLAIGAVEISLFSFISLGLVILGTILATMLLRALLNAKIYPLLEVDVGVAYAINTILKYALIVIGFLMALTALGVDLTAITVVAASLGVGIGFGLQTLVENLVSGFILLFGRSVEKGDYITVEDTYGQVQAVGARSVIVKTPDNFEMLIPSKELVGNRIINWSYRDDIVRATLEIGVAYGSEPERVREVLLETTERHPHVLQEPEPSVRLAEFGDSSVNFELLFFFDCRTTTEGKVVGELNYEVWEALEEADITIPFPQRDVHVKSPPKPHDASTDTDADPVEPNDE